jgi:hypothetical protein
MNTEDLIERLGREATPVVALPTPERRTAMWVVWSLLYLAAVGVRVFFKSSATGVSASPIYVLQQIAAWMTGALAGWAALQSVIPGSPHRVRVLVAAAATCWLGLLLWTTDARETSTALRGTDWPCVLSMLTGGVLLGAPLAWMLRQGAALTPRTTAALGAIAALSVGNVEACLTRPHPFTITVVLWHGGTILAAALVSALLARVWLQWPVVGSVRHTTTT